MDDARKAARYEEHEDIEKQALRWNGTVARWTVMLTLVGCAGIYFNWKTLGAIQGQLNEMKSGSVDAHNLAQSAADQARAAAQSAATAQENFLSSQRSWVGTIGANLAAGIVGSILRGNVVYVNSGREPAKIQISLDEYTFSSDEWNNGFAVNAIDHKSVECARSNLIQGDRFAWPTNGFNSYNISFPNGTVPQRGIIIWTPEMVSGQAVITVQGCILYMTVNTIHHTSFCYYFKARETDASHLGICTVGSGAN